jgi:hypothetical protein
VALLTSWNLSVVRDDRVKDMIGSLLKYLKAVLKGKVGKNP